MKSPIVNLPKTYITIIVITFILAACKKDKINNESGGLANLLVECDCDTIPPFSGWSPEGTYPTIDDSTMYFNPKFNPNNDNEIAFFDQDTYGTNGGIYKLNLLTNIKTPIYAGVGVSTGFSWSSKDWIIFQKTVDFNLYKIKSNGDSLTQLTFEHQFFDPHWNYNGTKFVSYHKFANKTMILDENANILDTLEGWYGGGDWQNPNYIAGLPQSTHIVIMHVESKTVIKEINNQLPNTFTALGWATNEKFIYGDSTGLFSYWINNNVKQKMRNYCNSAHYGAMSRNSSSTKLVFCKDEQKIVDIDGVQYLHQDAKLVIMNTDGSDEQEIIIP